MSGILGLYRLDGAPAAREHVDAMASLLAHRGPDRIATMLDGPVALGHALLATTPEAAGEHLPLVHAATGCTITADVRLDNRDELIGILGLVGRPGDAEIVLEAYLRWGDTCPGRLLGDFAFAIWDPRRRIVLCARDQLGMRSLLYHHAPGRLLAFATEARAILVVPDVPHRLHEARIADALVPRLEGVDATCTFFEDVHRLPPAHTLVVTPGGAWLRRYWQPEPGPELRLTTGEATEAFVDVLTASIRSRLRTIGPAGSMMSGGLDSSTAAALASRLQRESGRPALHTFSGVGPPGATDPETLAVHAMLALDAIVPTTVSHAELDALLPELEALQRQPGEPFDGGMAIIHALYLAARGAGLRTLLDGVSGDIVLADGQGLARLVRAGHWRAAYRELQAENRFWEGDTRPRAAFLAALRTAYAPGPVRRITQARRRRAEVAAILDEGLLSADLARRVDLEGRLRRADGHGSPLRVPDRADDRAQLIGHPFVPMGRERYDRVAGASGIEPRDPYLDLRVVSLTARLPDRLLVADGWPKLVLRRAGDGLVPDAVRWRLGRSHLGWEFTDAVMSRVAPPVWEELLTDMGPLEAFLDREKTRTLLRSVLGGSFALREEGYTLANLALWVRHHAERPKLSHNQGRTRQ